jgi:hypothetical protein
VAGISIAILVYVACGLWSALVFSINWRESGRALGLEWLGLASIAFLLWPLILAEDSIHKIRNLERNRIARLRRRV